MRAWVFLRKHFGSDWWEISMLLLIKPIMAGSLFRILQIRMNRKKMFQTMKTIWTGVMKQEVRPLKALLHRGT